MERKCFDCSLGPCEKHGRKCEGIDEDISELSGGVRTDWYGSDVVGAGVVSIEGAAAKELGIKDTIDGAVAYENNFNEGEHQNGLPPCIRAKKSF